MGTEVKPIIAVDFDGTLCLDCYPDIGKPIHHAIDYILERKKQGARLILWTCRHGQELDNAIEWCKKHGIIFDAINDNLPENVEKYGHNSRKIYADIYLDDHMCCYPLCNSRKKVGL